MIVTLLSDFICERGEKPPTIFSRQSPTLWPFFHTLFSYEDYFHTNELMADDNGKSFTCDVIHCLNETRFFLWKRAVVEISQSVGFLLLPKKNIPSLQNHTIQKWIGRFLTITEMSLSDPFVVEPKMTLLWWETLEWLLQKLLKIEFQIVPQVAQNHLNLRYLCKCAANVNVPFHENN